MKTLVQSYTFDPALQTITINGISALKLEDLLLITNVTDNIIIYNFADELCGGSIVGNVITLKYDTTTMSSTDSLQIFIDTVLPNTNDSESFPIPQQFTYDTNMNSVFGSQPLYEGDKLKTKTAMMNLSEVKGRIGALSGEISIDCNGAQTVALQLSGTWVGTVVCEGSVNGGDFTVVYGMNPGGLGPTTTLTSNAQIQFNVSGLKRFRARVSAWTSGAALVQLTATAALSRVVGTNGALGSQAQLLTQKATSFELTTWDNNLAAVLGYTNLIRSGFLTVDGFSAPSVNPTQPTSYPDNKYATVPQRQPRMRVEIGGSGRLPFAQEPYTNKMLVHDDVNRRLLEEILIELKTLNERLINSN